MINELIFSVAPPRMTVKVVRHTTNPNIRESVAFILTLSDGKHTVVGVSANEKLNKAIDNIKPNQWTIIEKEVIDVIQSFSTVLLQLNKKIIKGNSQ